MVFKSSEEADRDYVKKNLQDFDIIHYAGHVKSDPDSPHRSGLVLSDGILSAEDILKMADRTGSLPGVIFCNACQSGSTDKWSKKKDAVDDLYASEGLVHAFMKVGVKHYIGTFSLISDKYGSLMGIEFYHHFFQGKTIGESLRKARCTFKEKYGTESLAWINYVLYGDPCISIISPEKKTETSTRIPPDRISAKSHDQDPSSETLSQRVFSSILPSKKRIEPLFTVILIVALVSLVLASISRFGKQPPPKETDSGEAPLIGMSKDERVQETIELIRTIIKERREKQASMGEPPAPMDLWTSTPMTIFILVFIDKSGTIPGWTVKIIKEIDRKLTQNFEQDKRTRIAERKVLDKILIEKHLELINLPLDNMEFQKLFGEFLFARSMILLEGFESVKGGFYLCYKLIDITKGEIYKIDSDTELTDRLDPKILAQTIYSATRFSIYKQHPLRGKIVALQNNIAVINIGSDVGVQEADVFLVFDSTVIVGRKKAIGRLRVVSGALDEKIAECEILAGRDLSEGFKVEALIDNED